MSEETKLRDALVSAFEHLKKQDAVISALMCQSLALQEAALEGNLERLVRFQEALAREVLGATDKMTSSAQIFDSIIGLLKSDTRWIN